MLRKRSKRSGMSKPEKHDNEYEMCYVAQLLGAA
jgi:hypothetical protein